MTSASINVRLRGRLGSFDLDASFSVPAKGVTAIFGPSGCGKTTVLRAVAGLTHIADAHISVDGDVWQDGKTFRPVHQRPIGYVFQEASLFPHLSVRANMLFGAPANSSQAAISFDEACDLLGLSHLLDRSPQNLSGGERQRVAIARALLSQPRLLLMDEPLSALDKLTKDEILPFLEQVHERLSLPVLYVSHDMTEIDRLAEHLVLMRHGQVLAAGPIGTLQSDPTLPLAAAREAAVSLDAVVEMHDPADGLMSLSVPGGRFLVPSDPAQIGEIRRLRILSSDVSLACEPPNRSTIVNILRARILSVQAAGDHQVTAVLGLGEDGSGARILSRVTQRSWTLLGLAPGMSVYAQIKGVALVRRRATAATTPQAISDLPQR